MKKYLIFTALLTIMIGCDSVKKENNLTPPTITFPTTQNQDDSINSRYYKDTSGLVLIEQIEDSAYATTFDTDFLKTDDNGFTLEDRNQYLFNNGSCDQVILRKTKQTDILTCYDDNYKSALYVSRILKKDFIDRKNIVKRPYFKKDPLLREDLQVEYSDYTHSGYDRGHLASDASFDYSKEDQKKTYFLSNVIPQDHTVNAKQWVDAENRSRELAREYGRVQVIDAVEFSENPKRIGKAQMAVSKGFWKIIKTPDTEECYYYNNFIIGDTSLDTLSKHKKDCSLFWSSRKQPKETIL